MLSFSNLDTTHADDMAPPDRIPASSGDHFRAQLAASGPLATPSPHPQRSAIPASRPEHGLKTAPNGRFEDPKCARMGCATTFGMHHRS